MLVAATVHLPAALVLADEDNLARMRQEEAQRAEVIARAAKSVVCILTPDQANGGSGVIITPDGYGLTNFHVVMGMLQTRKALAGLSDGKTYPLEVLGIDPTGDLAMFRLTGRDSFDPAPLGDSDAVRLGDEVLALGNPFMLAEDFSPTATFGVVSGLNRYQFGADARALVYTDCIQIDASINPGNSGGPLFDLQGRLIGINGRASFKRDDPLRQRVNVGVAYAISINQVKRFIPALAEGWLVEHGSLGATVADTPEGVCFDNIIRPSAADRAGIQHGDELINFDGRPITSANAFANILGVYPAGWPVTVTFRRGQREYRREIELDPLPLKADAPWPKADPDWIRSVAKGAIPTTVPVDLPAMVNSSPAEHTADELMDRLLSAVVKVEGARIANQPGYATGVIVSPQGRVITPLAVLLEAGDLRVVTADGRSHGMQVVYRDDIRQLALLEPRETQSGWPAASIEQSVNPQPGDRVYVVGNPFRIADRLEPCSVSRGIVSGFINLDATRPNQGRPSDFSGQVLLMDTISSNPGSPGSAVFDADGRWIGLVGEVLESRLTHTPLNYAYPAHEIAAFLKKGSGVFSGRGPEDATHEANPNPLPSPGPGYHGIRLSRIGYRQRLPFIDKVATDSPAARAGVQTGDLIVGANGQTVSRSRVFEDVCAKLRQGDELSLVLKRDEQIVTVSFKLEEVPQ